MKEYAGAIVICGLLVAVIVAIVGYKIGVWEASERFYDECQGGEVYFKQPSAEKLTPSVGCAEIARHVR